VPRQRRIDATCGQSIELPLTEFAELRAVASVPEIGSQDRDGELLEAIAKSTADDDHVNFSEH
jgi:hypothetical protein